MSKIILSTITAVVIGTSGLLGTEVVDKSTSVSFNPEFKKDVIVVPNTPLAQTEVIEPEIFEPEPCQVFTPATSSSGFSDTIVYASSAKKSYMVNESINIRLKLKRKAFIYFWTISSSGNGYLILPNDFESYITYRANTDYVVPERSADFDFVSDRAGVEQIYILATNKKIPSNTIKSIFQNRQATNKSLKKFITKDIYAIARRQNLKYDIASFQVQVRDNNQNSTPSSSNQTPSNVNINIYR